MLAACAILVSDTKKTKNQDCMGMGNIAWLTQSFTSLDSVQLEIWPVAW